MYLQKVIQLMGIIKSTGVFLIKLFSGTEHIFHDFFMYNYNVILAGPHSHSACTWRSHENTHNKTS
jgi:hypothetical protein